VRLKEAQEEEARAAFDAELADLRASHERARQLLAEIKYELAWRRLCRKYGYNPNQPRDDLGKWTYAGGSRTRLAGPAIGRGIARLGATLPGARYDQLVRLDQAIARTESAVARVRQYEPTWKPTQQEITASPAGIQAAIDSAEGRAKEAEARLDQLRLGIGGNSRLQPSSTGTSSAPLSTGRYFDAQAWINTYRAVQNTPDMFGQSTWPADKGTVAVARIDGLPVFGVNSGAPGYDGIDRADANSWRARLLAKYPELMDRENIGWTPNNSFYHAESNLLLRAARENDGTLTGRNIEVHTDRDMCDTSCPFVLPKLGLELGNPTVSFVGPNGLIRIMQNGRWLP